jgi:hypothetical protein
MAACLPGNTVGVLGIRLKEIRGWDLYRSLPPSWLSALDLFREANIVWIAYNAKDVLAVAAGQFSAPPPGAVLVAPQIALAGSDALVQAAIRQHATHRTGASALLMQAAPVADKPIWAVIRGDAPLPLRGNGANLTRALRFTQYTTVVADGRSGLDVAFHGYCATEETARHLEESLRALATLVGRARAPDLVAVLKSVAINREGTVVTVTFQASPAVLENFLR